MNKETINNIDNILTTREKKISNAQAKQNRKATEHAQALSAFRAVVNTIIKPQMTNLGNHLKSKGIRFEIKMFKEGYEPDGTQFSPEDICFMMSRDSFCDFCWPSVPHASFMLDSRKNKIIAVESEREIAEYEINEITNEIIDKHIVHVLANLP